MRILAIDTSNYPLGVAVIDGDKVVAEYITNLKRNHSLRIMPAIESAMKEAEINPADLNKIVVAEGPGSYTGVRIGVTIAKTMAWTLGIPLSGVSSLEVMAMSGRYFQGYISPIFDARRGQVYTGLYKFENSRIVSIEEDQLVLLDDWASKISGLTEKTLFIGNDVSLHKETIERIIGGKAVFAAPSEMNPRPSELAFLGKDKPNAEVHSFVPNYIRLAEAEANWLKSRSRSHE
ncbi:tRNA (adenosine(37)-N6)-threonylcarbamoyltransferase complex dimerization subunit type 1 TsaB [Bacillus sp. FJAT-27445]|uniref:tRNA (adenosine(37)-N6)-threonylcarbamoyltransferase complex dimerization subunit type 1 TsaB n=1 Tax=Bacillus sp. FJAT-27445 TaxID=1679166 RepID=UPI000743C08F|nr:tRNA (adenosine(37)-N6)-threonylcarbamoyltransferase complex dimerization subunit type 1 TsaB [Bacillus sp. FJAT-27445]